MPLQQELAVLQDCMSGLVSSSLALSLYVGGQPDIAAPLVGAKA